VIKTKRAKNHIKHLTDEKGYPITDIYSIRVETPLYRVCSPNLLLRGNLPLKLCNELAEMYQMMKFKLHCYECNLIKLRGLMGIMPTSFRNGDIVGTDICRAIQCFLTLAGC